MNSPCPARGVLGLCVGMAQQDAFQGEQTEPDKTFDSQPMVVVTRLALVFHTAQTHPDPRIELVEPFSIRSPSGAEVMSGAPDDSVELPVQMTENDIGQQRRDDTALRCANSRWLEPTVLSHP